MEQMLEGFFVLFFSANACQFKLNVNYSCTPEATCYRINFLFVQILAIIG